MQEELVNYIKNVPIQTVSLDEKTKDDFKWAKLTSRAYLNQANFGSTEYEEFDTILNAVEGNLNETDYKYILNPINSKEKQYQSFPAKLRNMPIIEPVINLLMGDFLNRFRIEQVIALNSDVDNELKQKINVELEVYFKQTMINNLNNLGVDTGVDSKQIDIKKIVEDIIDTFDDKLSIQGQDILDYLYSYLDLDDKWQELAYYYFCIGVCDTFRESRLNDVRYEVKDPRDMWYTDDDVTYGEDKTAAVCRIRFTLNQFLSEFYDEIGDDENLLEKIRSLDNSDSLRTFNATVYNNGQSIIGNTRNTVHDKDYANFIIGYHVNWKARKKEGELTFTNIFGEEDVIVVDESYVFDESKGDISIKWYWTEEVWESYLFGDDLHFRTRICEVQRNQLNNRSTSKLSYNRRRVMSKTKKVSSVGKTGMPYQALYNIYHYQRELIINKSKDKVMLMPLGLIPTKPGWTIDKFLYYMSSLNLAIFDDTSPNAAAIISALKVLDMSLSQYVSQMTELLDSIKFEFWDVIGINRQRYGEVNSSDGKATTEQALFRSALINAELFRQLEKFKEKEANALIDIAKVAYLDGKKATFITGEGYTKILEITGADILDVEFGIFSKMSEKEIKKTDYFKNLSLTILQNEGNVSDVAEIVDTDNFSKMKKIMKKADKARKTVEQAQAEFENQVRQLELETEKQDKIDKNLLEKYKVDVTAEATIEVANIQAGIATDKLEKESKIAADALNLESRKVDIEKTLKEQEIRVKEIAARNKGITKTKK